MDFEKNMLPVWGEPPEAYYNPEILELELEKTKKELNELKYEISELDKDNQLLRTEIKTKEKEKTELEKIYKENTVKLPFYQTKVMELNKTINKLNADNKSKSMVISSSKEKREEIEKKYNDVMDSYTALMSTNKQLEKIIAKFKLENSQELKDKDRIKAENDKKKNKNDELEIQIKGLRAQISHHADELRSKEIISTGLARDNKILKSKIENALLKLTNSEEHVTLLEKKMKTMKKDCSESITKYSSLLHENNHLKAKLNESDELSTTVEEMKTKERSLYKQINALKRTIAIEQSENKKLKENNQQLEKQKTKYIYTGEDITVTKRKLEECMKQNLNWSKKFSNLDCPFYQSKYDKIDENTEPKIKYGSLTERHYENKIFALEQVIKTLHLKIESQEEKHLKYRDVVIKSVYDKNAAEQKIKSVNGLLEEQKYKIIYDRLDVLSKESKIKKLEIQRDNFEYQCKLLNRQSTLLCKKIKDYNLKIESMKKDYIRANKIFQNVGQKNDELKNKTVQLEKCTENIEMQLLNNNKCKKRQQSEVNKMKSSMEKYQRAINKTQEELNRTKQNNIKLENSITELLTQREFNRKIQSKDINEIKSQIEKLSVQNKKLKFENKNLSKFKDENKLLQFKLMTEERRLANLQNKFNNLYNEKERKIHTKRIPETL